DPSKLEKVYLAVEPFRLGLVAAHCMAVYQFSEPIPGLDGDKRLVVSVEARLRDGQKYSALKGFGKNFGLIYQLCSFGDRCQKSCQHQDHHIILHELELTGEQQQRLLANSLQAALKDHSGELYHNSRNSCFTNQVDLLNTVLPDRNQIP